jgi:hypothetical protein
MVIGDIMKEEIQNILESIKGSIKDVDIKGIFAKQIEVTVQQIARDMFREHSDFGKILQEKLKEEVTFNLREIKVPQFGHIAAEIVKGTLEKVEIDEKEKIEKLIVQNITEYLGTKKESLKEKDLVKLFCEYVYEEEKYSFNCSCGEEQSSLEDFFDTFDAYNIDTKLNLLETTNDKYKWSYSKEGDCHTHLVFEYEKDGKVKYGLNIYIYRIKDDNDDKNKSNNFWRKESKNKYRIMSIKSSSYTINCTGMVKYRDLENELERTLMGAFHNDVILDLSDLDHIELVKS